MSWFWTLTIFGAVTAVFASVLALRQTDLKQALAYTTLMALGTLTLFLGAGSRATRSRPAMTFLIVHSLYKAALFLMVGHRRPRHRHARDVDILGGLARAMPVTAVGGGAGGDVDGGLPALPRLHRQGTEIRGRHGRRSRAAVSGRRRRSSGANALMFAVAGIVAFARSGGRPADRRRRPRTRRPGRCWLGPVILAALAVALRARPVAASRCRWSSPAVAAILGDARRGQGAQALGRGEHAAHPVASRPSLLGFAALCLCTAGCAAALAADRGAQPPSFDRGWDRRSSTGSRRWPRGRRASCNRA